MKQFQQLHYQFVSEINYSLIYSIDLILICTLSLQTLTKKENKGCESPEPDMDPYGNSLTPDEKYSRLNDEYQRAMHQNSMRVSVGSYKGAIN